MLLSEEIRNWLLLFTAMIGSFIAINTFIKNLQQRKIENTYRYLDFIRAHITDTHINRFVELFHANNPIVTSFDEFHFPDGRKESVVDMFSEGGCGNGEIHNMIELFNLISPQLIKEQINVDLVWYEYGQMMDKFYGWTKQLEKVFKKPSTQSLDKYSKEDIFIAYSFNRFMEKERENLLFKPRKHYTYLE